MAPTACSLPSTPPSSAPGSEEVWQDESWRFGLHTVDPEVGAAGVILVAPVQQLEVVRLRVKRLAEKKGRRFKIHAHFTHSCFPVCEGKGLLLCAGLGMGLGGVTKLTRGMF